jgi:hypothetical protein
MTVDITRGHGDTFFGLNMILGAFPNARAVTAAAVVPQAQGQVSPGPGTNFGLSRPTWLVHKARGQASTHSDSQAKEQRS